LKKGLKFASFATSSLVSKKGKVMIYLSKFLHATNQEQADEARRRHGEFNMIIEAENKDAALESFRRRLYELRETTDFFEGSCLIYLVQLLELDQFPDSRASLLFYKSVAGDPVMPFISCTVPSTETDGCRIYEWGEKTPEIDGLKAKPFLQFEA
jgi:hypothetical protein